MTGLIVHEWVEGNGGSERVVDDFLATFPDSDVLTLWDDTGGRFGPRTYETWLAKSPLRKHKALTVPILPAVWRRVRLPRTYEWLLVSSHLFAHHVRLVDQPSIPKLVYAHTPARYIWEPETDSRGRGLLARAASAGLRPLDRHRAREPLSIAANSEFTRQRIIRTWHRDAEVIYPPVDTDMIVAGGDWTAALSPAEGERLERLPRDYLLGASRFVPYKRLDLVIEAGEATDTPVVLAGGGSGEPRLRELAQASTVPVHFVHRPSDVMLLALYQRARAYIFPAIEDFGIMPVEAMATGTPVIVQFRGGASESVRMLSGGVALEELSARAWREALAEVSTIDRTQLASRTLRLSRARFQDEVRAWVSRNTPIEEVL